MDLRKLLTITAAGLVTLVAVVAALGLGALALERRAHHRLDAALAEPMAALLPGGRVRDVDVTDSPALLAARRGSLQQAVVRASSGGHEVLVIVRGLDRAAQRAGSVSWEVSGIAFAPGWAGVRAASGAYTDHATATVDGHRYEVTASADIRGDGGGASVLLRAGALRVDGAPTSLADAPAAVRHALAPVPVPVPDPQEGLQVRRTWFDEQGCGIELFARDVGVR